MATAGYARTDVADLPFRLAPPLAERLRTAADVECKLVRALQSLGPLAGRDVALLDVPGGGTVVVDIDAFDGSLMEELLPAAAPIVGSFSFAVP